MSVLALIAREDSSPLGWIIQAGAVFIFFVLPVLRGISESRKRAAAKGGAAAKGHPAPRAERDGRELWRDLLEGRQPQAPASTPAPQARPSRPAQPVVRRTPTASSAPAPAAAPVTTQVGRPLAPLEKQVSAPGAAAPSRQLVGSLAPASSMLSSSFRSSGGDFPSPDIDPATLDDELFESWGANTRPGQTRSVAGLLVGADLRRAVVLSELLAPPLALRGPSASWPGPPMAFGS